MTSKVYYKFKSQKNPSEISFDGTGISVFDLKREILLHSKLAPIAETIDLQVINPDTKEEYADDTEVIPRSMSVVARRLPAARPGKDSAAKYVSGAVPSGGGKNASRQEASYNSTRSSNVQSNGQITAPSTTGSEEDKVSAMFEAQGEKWKQTQEHMATATPIYYTSHSRNGINAQVPDHPPPPGYICYRCGSKGHWIQACPTNNDPNWEGKRVRRTTGIPKTMLRTVKMPDDNASGTYMVNEDGEYVEVVADNKSWQNYQERTKAMRNKVDIPDDPELICPLTHKLFEKPVKTPCCKKTYSSEAIQQALLDSDFVCPNCKKEEILLDSLIPDTEMEEKVKAYKETKVKSEEPNEETKSTEVEETSLKRTHSDTGSDNEEHSDKKSKVEENGLDTKAENQQKSEENIQKPEQMVYQNGQLPMPFPMAPMPMMPPPFMMPGMPPFMMPPFMMNQNNNAASKPTNNEKS